MTDTVQAAPGVSNTSGLATIEPQPDTDGVTYPRKIISAGGLLYFDGNPYCVLRFPDIMTPVDAVATLALFGLADPAVAAARVTVRLPDEDKLGWTNWNGIAERWVYGDSISFHYTWYEHPRIKLRKLVAI